MTTPRYPAGACAAGSKAQAVASSSDVVGNPQNAWGVNFNNGSVNNNHRDNNNFARAVAGPVSALPGEYQRTGRGQVTLRSLYTAWRAARRGKKPSSSQLTFDANWLSGLLHLLQQLITGTWAPGATACFIAQRPKAREIHAPCFADRVVHHWLIPQLEALYERIFIHHSFSNRAGKGTHAAVDCLAAQVRQAHSGQGGGWYLQLDVRNFFLSIRRDKLWLMLKPVLLRAGMSPAVLHATHALLRHPPLHYGVHHHSTERERARVPAHKRLENAAPGCGLPIGNLSSQFFANVYLNALDQYVKHVLKVPRYVRYVDDFVLIHQDREQLLRWQAQIETFLRDQLHLTLKPERKLQRLESGIDFLGYIIHPHHKLPRRRVVGHAREALHAWAQQHIQQRGGQLIARATPSGFEALRATWASYQGHLRHANAHRLTQSFYQHFPWLEPLTAIRRRWSAAQQRRWISVPLYVQAGAA